MEPVYAAVHHTVPMYVHLQEEPGEFEWNVAQLCVAIAAHRNREDAELRIIGSRLSDDERHQLEDRVLLERRRALERPHPGRHMVTRLFERLLDGMDRHLPDTGAQYRPGRDKLAS